MSVFFHNPPETPPAYTVLFVASFGSNIITLVLPPTLLGPLSSHAFVAFPGVFLERRLFFNSSLSLVRFPSSNLPVEGFIVNSHICSKYLFGGKPFNFLFFLSHFKVS